MLNFNRDKKQGIWFLSSLSLDRILHELSCESSTVPHFVLSHFGLSDTKA